MQAGKRLLLVGALAAAAVAAVVVLGVLGYASGGGTAAAAAQYGGPPQDIVTGSGKITGPGPNGENVTEQFIVGAHSGPNGEDPDGQITFHSPLLESNQAMADVTCMVVSGNHAQVGGMFPETITYTGFRLKWIEVIIDDNGSPGQATDTMNAFVFLDRPRPPGFSPCNFTAPTDFQVEEGNFTVTDGVEHSASRIR